MNASDSQPPTPPPPAADIAARKHRQHQFSLGLYPSPVLRAVCPPVETFDSTLRDLVQEMFELMRAHCGIGLAGPQVALEQRVLVAAFEDRRLCLTNPHVLQAAQPGEFIEGCLSLPGLRRRMSRPERIRVTGYDQTGRKISFAATGLWARVIQHELDHLNGVLICDRGCPVDEECEQIPVVVPAVLVKERERHSTPGPGRSRRSAPQPGPTRPGSPTDAL